MLTENKEVFIGRKVVICDLDGCVFDDEHRLHLADFEKKEFSAYHDKLSEDTILQTGAAFVQTAIDEGHVVVFFTARPESHRYETKDKLERTFNFQKRNSFGGLFMRKEFEEGEAAPILKSKTLHSLLRYCPGIKILAAIDDHIETVQMYKNCGLNAYLVNKEQIVSARSREFVSFRAKTSCESYYGQFKNLLFVPNYYGLGDVNHKSCDEFIEKVFVSVKQSIKLEHQSQSPVIVTQYKPNEIPAADRPSAAFDVAFTPVEDAEEFYGSDPARVEDIIRPKLTAADILSNGSETFRQRQALYKDNAFVHSSVMKALFPNGVNLSSPEEFHIWHLLDLLIVKLTRFTNSGLTHQDSIHDLMVYAAMIEASVGTHKGIGLPHKTDDSE